MSYFSFFLPGKWWGMISVGYFHIKTKPEIQSSKFQDTQKRKKTIGRAAVTRPAERVTTAAPGPRWLPSVPGPRIGPSAPPPPQVDGDDDDDGGSDQRPHLDSLMREERQPVRRVWMCVWMCVWPHSTSNVGPIFEVGPFCWAGKYGLRVKIKVDFRIRVQGLAGVVRVRVRRWVIHTVYPTSTAIQVCVCVCVFTQNCWKKNKRNLRYLCPI